MMIAKPMKINPTQYSDQFWISSLRKNLLTKPQPRNSSIPNNRELKRARPEDARARATGGEVRVDAA